MVESRGKALRKVRAGCSVFTAYCVSNEEGDWKRLSTASH